MNASEDTVRAAIISQNEALREELSRQLPELWQGLTVCGAAETGQAGLELIDNCRPQLVFCDMPLPDLCGMELGLGLAGKCHPVFLLDRDELPLDRLERVTVDFLLKPINREQIRRKLDDIKHRFFEACDRKPPVTDGLKTLRVIDQNQIRMLPVEQILAIEHQEKGCLIHTADGTVRTNHTLRELMAELSPNDFRPIHRHVMIQVAAMEALERIDEGELHVRLTGLERTFPVNMAFSGLFGKL